MTSKATQYRALLTASQQSLRTVVAGVPADAWASPTPCEQWNVTQVLQHATGDQLAYAAAITGTGGPTENPFTPSGQLSGPPGPLVDDVLDVSQAAWARVADDTDVPTPLPQGALPTWLALGAAALDAAVHAWDIAAATGQPSPLNAGDAVLLHAVATELVEPLRQYGAYAAALPADTDDDQVDTLLKYLGRQPHRTR